MSSLNKSLKPDELTTLDLFIQGALAPLEGYLNRDDHISVLTDGRLANGYLWPLPFALALTPAEKLQAQLAGKVALLDNEQRVLAEVQVDTLYRLPKSLLRHNQNSDTWYVSGRIIPQGKVLHPAFNQVRHNAKHLRHKLRAQGWNSVIALHATEDLDATEMHQACEWLKASACQAGGILLQITANDHDPHLHPQIHAIRQQVRCNAAKQVRLSLLPALHGLSAERQLLLQALIARNYGATGFLISARTPKTTQRWLLRHRDEIGLELIVAKASLRRKQGALPVTLAA